MTRPANSPRRSALYLPASNARAIEKARSLPADVIIFDLEDAVAPGAKAQARQALVEAFAQAGFGHRETVIRTNEIGSDDYALDLAAIARCGPAAVLLPKVSDPGQVERFAADAASAGLAEGIASWFMIETVAALMNLPAIVAAGRRARPVLDCLVVGTNDIAKETGVSPDNGRACLVPWLMSIVLTAKHQQVAVLDGVWNDFKDMAGFEAETRQGRAMGFDGKTLIHPTQVALANEVFSPSASALADARLIVEAFRDPAYANAGVINLDGRMVERLHLAQAQRLLAIDEAIRASTGAV